MREFVNVRQVPGESKRRWFSSPEFDLIVWQADDGSHRGFELCYRTGHRERAIVWTREGGYRHMAVDDGEGRAGAHKATPIMGLDGRFDAEAVHAAFAAARTAVPEDIATFVLTTLRAHPDFGRPEASGDGDDDEGPAAAR